MASIYAVNIGLSDYLMRIYVRKMHLKMSAAECGHLMLVSIYEIICTIASAFKPITVLNIPS